MNPLFNTFKPFNRCAPFKPLNFGYLNSLARFGRGLG